MSKCGNCHWLVTEEGKPYYCAIKDLYTIRDEQDNACSEYVEKDESYNEEIKKMPVLWGNSRNRI